MLRAAVTRFLCVFSLFLSHSVSATSTHGVGCDCPEASPDWTVYPDSARGAPDFYKGVSVQLGEVLVCDGAAHLLFQAKQGGVRRRVCLTVAEPTFDQLLHRLPTDSVPGDEDLAKLETQLEGERSFFVERMSKLRDLLEKPAQGNQRASFKTGWLRRPPRLYPGSPLVIRWKDRRVELTGTVDVLFRQPEE